MKIYRNKTFGSLYSANHRHVICFLGIFLAVDKELYIVRKQSTYHVQILRYIRKNIYFRESRCNRVYFHSLEIYEYINLEISAVQINLLQFRFRICTRTDTFFPGVPDEIPFHRLSRRMAPPVSPRRRRNETRSDAAAVSPLKKKSDDGSFRLLFQDAPFLGLVF